MPLYLYRAKNSNKRCEYCGKGFDLLQKSNSEAVKRCPKCGAPVKRIITNFSIGISKSSLDTKAREKGFHKLKRLNKGEYEKEY
ncbi:MAG: hypothetical protein AMJ43_10450 [Coxiella sp. DG_40]|jgi:putative FmdB family regulatory protein|nr:MAG: hypothetical protein AMJ43_10450 [Coxiella sp. DG_40]